MPTRDQRHGGFHRGVDRVAGIQELEVSPHDGVGLAEVVKDRLAQGPRCPGMEHAIGCTQDVLVAFEPSCGHQRAGDAHRGVLAIAQRLADVALFRGEGAQSIRAEARQGHRMAMTERV